MGLLELTAKPFAIVSMVRLLPEAEWDRNHFLPGVDETWADAEDPVVAVALRVYEHPKTGALSAELLVRHENGAKGPALLESKLKAAVAAAAAAPEARAVRALIGAVTTRIDGRDVIAALELGTGREAAGTLSKLAVVIGTFGLVAAPAEVPAEPVMLEVEGVPLAEPVPEKKKDGGEAKR